MAKYVLAERTDDYDTMFEIREILSASGHYRIVAEFVWQDEALAKKALDAINDEPNKHSDDVSPQAVDKLAGEMLDKLSTQHLETVQPGEIGKHVENLSSYPVSVYGTPTQNPSIGKRVMYEDGTPSREYEDEPTKTP